MITPRSLLEMADLGVATGIVSAAKPPYTLPKCRMRTNVLEPYIEAQTMQIHHDKHHQAYVDNLNKAISGCPELTKLSVDELVERLDTVPAAIRTQVRNQGGGHANHSLFWLTLAPHPKAISGAGA